MAVTAGYLGALYQAQTIGIFCDANGDVLTVTEPSDDHLDFNAVDFALEIWCKITDGAGTGFPIVSKWAGAGNAGYKLSIDAAGKFRFDIENTVAASVDETTVSTYDDGEWHHVVATYDANGLIKIRVDGVDDSTGAISAPGADLSNAVNVIAADVGANQTCAVGLLRIWKCDISVANAAILYGGRVPDNWISLGYSLGWWECNEGTGTIITDVSRYNANMVVTNAAWDAVCYETSTAEALGGASPNFTTAKNNVDYDTFQAYDGGTAIAEGVDQHLTPAGAFTCVIAGAATATYRWYPMVFERAGFADWSLTSEETELETTDFVNAPAKQFQAGTYEWTMTANRHWVNLGFMPTRGDTSFVVKAYWNTSTPARWEGWGFATGINPNVEVNALVEEALTIRGTHSLAASTS